METRTTPFASASAPRAGRTRVALLCAILWVASGLSASARADDDGLAGRELFRRGSKQVALLGGYGDGFRWGSARNADYNRELRDVGIVNVIPRLGFGLTDPIGDSWYRGNVETLLEGAFLINTDPRSGFAGGGGTSLRYNFLQWDRVVPFVDANLGLLDLDFDVESQSDGFNFNVGAGVGSHWFVSDRTAVTTEVRWQHISNARTKLPNNGINDVLYLLGVSYFWD